MDLHEQFRLANDTSTSSVILRKLALSEYSEIRASVAANTSSDNDTLLNFCGDKNHDVILNLKNNTKPLVSVEVSVCKNVLLTLANIDDAKFILSLRNNEKLNNYVSHVSSELEDQEKWLINYKLRESIRSEFYFIIRDLERNPLGTVRIYDFINGSFCWGSWMVNPNSPRKTAIESALAVYEFAFYTLGFESSHFDVRNKNEKVIKFHKRMGAEIIHKTELDTFFMYKKSDYESKRKKYSDFFVK